MITEPSIEKMRIGTSADRDLREQLRLRDLARTDRVCWIGAGVGVAWLGLYAALVAASQGSDVFERVVGDGIYLLPLATAAVLGILAARRLRGRAGRMWKVLAASNVAWLLGELVWSSYSFFSAEAAPSPSAADALYLTSYALALPAIMVGFGHASSLRQVRGLLDAGLVVLGVGAVGAQFLIRPQLDGGADLTVLTSAAYPLLDLVLVACLISIGIAGHRFVPYSALFVGGAFAFAALSDTTYTYLVVVNELSAGSWINLGWQAQAVLLCLGALVALRHRETDAHVQQLDRDLTLVPVLVSALAAFVLVVLDRVESPAVDIPTLVIAGVMLVGLVLRQFLFTRDRTRLAHRLQASLAEQERLAVTDGLTGLYNRRFFLEMLKIEADRCSRRDHPLSLLVIDLDHFKKINDAHGHPVGDLVLVQAADRIRQISRSMDIVARYGGEEFIVLLPNTDDEVALELAERFRQTLRRSAVVAPGVGAITVTGSVGVATAVADPVTGELDRDQLVAQADRALYWAKSHGRDRTAVAPQGFADEPAPAEVPQALLWMVDRVDEVLSPAEHSTAVERWAVQVGATLGLPPERLAQLAAAARLHDIGKITTGEDLLAKPGALDAAEWKQLRRHSTEGARLLRAAGCTDLAPLVEAHHERHDGTGYPHGLAGTEIPLEARVIAVCDAWAAMRVARAYDGPRSTAEARREIENGRGGQFDPQVADAFLALVGQGRIDDPRQLSGTAETVGGSGPPGEQMSGGDDDALRSVPFT